jgi:hypothetical protein
MSTYTDDVEYFDQYSAARFRAQTLPCWCVVHLHWQGSGTERRAPDRVGGGGPEPLVLPGAAVALTLAAPPPSSIAGVAPLLRSPHAGKRVMVVDDELSNRRLAARMLQRMQMSTVALEDGDEVRRRLMLGSPLAPAASACLSPP